MSNNVFPIDKLQRRLEELKNLPNIPIRPYPSEFINRMLKDGCAMAIDRVNRDGELSSYCVIKKHYEGTVGDIIASYYTRDKLEFDKEVALAAMYYNIDAKDIIR